MSKKNKFNINYREKYSIADLDTKLYSFQEVNKFYCLDPKNDGFKDELHYLVQNITIILKRKRGVREVDKALKFINKLNKDEYEKSIYEGFLKN